MKLIANGATDAAQIVLFWCDNIPDGFNYRAESDPFEFA